MDIAYGQNDQIKWSKKANYGNVKTSGCVTFSLGGSGYLYDGAQENSFLKYDSKTDKWVKASIFPGISRTYPVAFTIGNMAYLGTGSYKSKDGTNDLKDIWQYDAANDKWVQKADFPGGIRHGAIAFSINGFGYIGLGGEQGTANSYTDLWKYDPKLDKWTKMADFPALGKIYSSAFTIKTDAYVLFGEAQLKFAEDERNMYSYNSVHDSWVKSKEFPDHVNSGDVVFSMNSKGYVYSYSANKDQGYSAFWEYDPETTTWTQEKADLVPVMRIRPFSFVIDSEAYIGEGRIKGSIMDSISGNFGCISIILTSEFNAKLLYNKNNKKVPLASQKLSLLSQKRVLQTTTTDSSGSFNFKKLDKQANYELVLDKNNALPANAIVSIAKPNGKILKNLEKNEDDQFTYEVTKLDFINEDDSYFNLQYFIKAPDKELTITTHINYTTKSWELSEEAEETLYGIIVSLKQYPNLNVEISSHTDAVGSDEENMKLSKKRAETVVDYIVANGISRNRVIGKGYGSTQLLNKCKHGVTCSEEENFVNRRTEFKFIKQ
jgi:outer membrane protein OmpA-like peptidoglycan-associated protein/N-acetylneuraminic acid mutarotase